MSISRREYVETRIVHLERQLAVRRVPAGHVDHVAERWQRELAEYRGELEVIEEKEGPADLTPTQRRAINTQLDTTAKQTSTSILTIMLASIDANEVSGVGTTPEQRQVAEWVIAELQERFPDETSKASEAWLGNNNDDRTYAAMVLDALPATG